MIATLALPCLLPVLAAPQDLESLAPEGLTFTLHERLMQVPEDEASPADSNLLDLDLDPEGDGPVEMAYTPDGGRIAVVNSDSDLVTFLDTTTRAVLATVPVGNHPLDVEVSPDGALAVVANALDHTISVIDLATYTVAATIDVTSTQPYRVVITPDSRHAVVGVIGQSGNSRISVVDLVTRTEELSFPTTPQGSTGTWSNTTTGATGQVFTTFELSSDGATLLLADYSGGRLSVYNVATGNKVKNINTDGSPASIDVSSDGTLAAVASTVPGGAVQVIDMASLTVISTVDDLSPMFFSDVVLTDDHATAAYVDAFQAAMIDLATGTVTIFPGTTSNVALSFDDRYLLAAGLSSRIIDVATKTVVAQVPGSFSFNVLGSPVERRASLLDKQRHEEVRFYDIDGAASALEDIASTGSAPEADVPREVALTPDGRRALIGCMSSVHGVLVDLETRSVLSRPELGRLNLDLEITPDGTTGLIVAQDSAELIVLDLASGAALARLDVPPDPTQVEVSPDGTQAYVRSWDRLSFVDLNGAASVVTGSLAVQGGWAAGGFRFHAYTDLSLSPDGALLALFGTNPYELVLVDAVSHVEVARFPAGTGAVGATWSSDSGTLYVANAWANSVQQFRDQGGTWAETGVSVNHPSPLRATVGPDDRFLYVSCLDEDDPHIRVVRTATMKKVAKLPLPGVPREQVSSVDMLFVAMSSGEIARIRMAGPATHVVEVAPLSGEPVDLAFSAALGTAVVTLPIEDGASLVSFGGTPITYCDPAELNSSGGPGVISATGTFLAGGQPLTLEAAQLPVNEFGLFLASTTQGASQPPGSQGDLCLAGTIHRFSADVQFSGAAGAFGLAVDTTDLPLGGAIQPGETWNFQAWFRDANPAPTSNFTDAVSATFE